MKAGIRCSGFLIANLPNLVLLLRHKSHTTIHPNLATTWVVGFHAVKLQFTAVLAMGIGLYNLSPISISLRILPMLLKVFSDKTSLGGAAAEQAANAIRRAISERGKARIIAATAASQREFV